MGGSVTKLDNFDVVAVDGEGVGIVDSANNVWIVFPDQICQRRDEDDLAKAYRAATS